MKKMNLLVIAVGILVSGFAQASSLAAYKAVINSRKVSSALTQVAKDEKANFTIENVKTIATFRCLGCYELRISIRGVPTDGREILLLKAIDVRTRASMTGNNKLEIVSVNVNNDFVD